MLATHVLLLRNVLVAIFVLTYIAVLVAATMSALRAPNFWAGVLSDGDHPSFSRVCTGALVLATIGWNTYIVVVTKAMPDVGGEALLIGILYGANVAGGTITKVAGMKGEAGGATPDGTKDK